MLRYGFNFQWMCAWRLGQAPAPPDEKTLDFLAALAFNSVRIPTDYRFWTKDFDYLHPDESIFEYLDRYLQACRSRGIQMSLNLHRAPGYCINRNNLERHNLWLDPIAQDAFVFLWEAFAHRYKGVPNDALSFDLVNEPPDIGQSGLTRQNHAALIRRTVAAIRAIDSTREIVIDGLSGGNLAMPELADLGVIHSGRGYQPMPISHHHATWWPECDQSPAPIYPGLQWKGKTWNRDTLREYYRPWHDVENTGVQIHIGECGCFNQTPNEIALHWLTDLFGLFKEFKWGFSLWEFKGAFGIVEHGRPGGVYEEFHGCKVDRALLDLILSSRVTN
jgi:hypothetical protein